MTASEPGTRDLAEKVAGARHEAMDTGLSWQAIVESRHDKPMIARAAEWLTAIRAAGLAVVELPTPDVAGDTSGMRGARWGPVRSVVWSDGSEPCVRQSQLSGQLTADEAEVLAGRFLAAARWLREQGPAPEHDGSGPPVCEPCSADCPACAAEQPGGDSR